MTLPRLQSVKPTILAVALLVVTLGIFGVGLIIVDRAGEAIIARHQRLVAETARDFFVAFAHEEGLAPLATALDLRTQYEAGAFRYALFDSGGQQLGGAALLPAEQLPGPGFSVRSIGTGDQTQLYEVLVQPISSGGTLVVYEKLSERGEFRLAIVGAFAAALMVSVAIVAAVSLWFGRLLVQRAAGISAAAERISSGDLSARAPVGTAGDVFDKIAASVNAMLGRIEELLTGLQTVTDSLAHDLRSPLARLRGALSRALDPNIKEEERLSLIEQAQAGSEQVLATFGALLDIARAEAGLSREMMAPVDLTALVSSMGELFAPVIEDAGQEFTVRVPNNHLIVSVHELILRQALGNLLHNAARYAGLDAHVELALERSEKTIFLIVADDGPGVPPEDRGRVQERFIRLDSSRGTQGSGLGLAIAAACAKLHGGRLSLNDYHPGLRVVLEIPATQIVGVPS